uniref:Uncharacterized protein n=1 Tax=Anisakis simplex TaxID=6269 RepID=A0A0M3J4K1_ANISI
LKLSKFQTQTNLSSNGPRVRHQSVAASFDHANHSSRFHQMYFHHRR